MACSLVGRYPGSVRESVLQRIKGLMMESTLEAGSASSNGSQQ
jgi:hypothetical protein